MSPRWLPAPWAAPRPLSETVRGPRPCLWVDATVAEVRLATGSLLPKLGERELDGVEGTLWALPSTHRGVEGPGAITERVELKVGAAPLEVQVSGFAHVESLREAWEGAGARASAYVAHHVEASDTIRQLDLPPGTPWGIGSRVWVRSMEQGLEAWKNAGHGGVAHGALIVRLAEELREPLQEVCRRPRVQLERTRQLQSVGRVQQVDAACLRWLAGRPGGSVLEKAGPGQRVLAVRRVEHVDTYENRVVRDLLVRCADSSRGYLRDHGDHGDERKQRLVREFLRLCEELLRESRLAEASELSGPARSNYVLEREPRYAVLWQAYTRLVQQQQVVGDVWRWRREAWSESCTLATLAALRGLRRFHSSWRADLWLRPEPVRGRYVTPLTQTAPVYLEDRTLVEASLQSSDPQWFGADVVVTRCDAEGGVLREVGVWGLLEWGLTGDVEWETYRLGESLRETASAIWVVPPGARVPGHTHGRVQICESGATPPEVVSPLAELLDRALS